MKMLNKYSERVKFINLGYVMKIKKFNDNYIKIMSKGFALDFKNTNVMTFEQENDLYSG